MWLMPAQRKRTSSSATPAMPASLAAVPCTLWHRPTAGMSLARSSASMFIAIGLV